MDYRGYGAILLIVFLLPAGSIGKGTPRFSMDDPATWQQTAASPSSAAPHPSSSQSGASAPPAGGSMHSITVQFDYDFTKTPACSAKVTTSCVQAFDVYDISGEKPYLLFSIPAPPHAQGMMKGITATSPRMLFAIGKHRIGVSAQTPNGAKSPPRDCKVIIEIKADNPPNPPPSH